MWWWVFVSWLLGVVVCLVAVNTLWKDGGDDLGDRPWGKR